MRTHSIACCLIALVVVLSVTAPALAQGKPKADIAGSYSALYDNELGNEGYGAWMPWGWAVAVAGYLTPSVALVGEFGGNYKTVTEEGMDINLSIYTYQGGIRFCGRGNPKVVPFGQVLLGGGHASAGATGVSVSTNGFVVQPGAGVDIFITPNVGIRLQGDYRLFRAEGTNNNEGRFAVGIVYAFGSR